MNSTVGVYEQGLALAGNGIAISMDGKGAWRDNVFVERLWRSIKYDEVYRHAYDGVSEALASIGRYLGFYNRASEHPSFYLIEEKRFCWPGCDFCAIHGVGFCVRADLFVNVVPSQVSSQPGDPGLLFTRNHEPSLGALVFWHTGGD